MGDIEDAFLRQNVPGRYSSWSDAKDGDRRCAGGDDDVEGGGGRGGVGDEGSGDNDEEYFRDLPAPRRPAGHSPPPPDPSTVMRPSGNTGAKGVIADYREAQQLERLQREEDRLERLRVLQRATHPAVAAPSEISLPAPGGGGIDDGSDLDDEDDEFLKRFRSQRLAELREQRGRGTSSEPQRPRFGSLDRVNPEEYVDLVDSIDPRSLLVVHLYDDSVVHCRMLRFALERVAQSMVTVRFVEVGALEASPDLDTICLPALLVYSGGRLVHNLVRFADDLPRDFGVEDVRAALEGLLGARGSG